MVGRVVVAECQYRLVPRSHHFPFLDPVQQDLDYILPLVEHVDIKLYVQAGPHWCH